jgi:glycosyltransferase involved in cell wall biosynthesis
MNNVTFKVSVIIPAHNAESFIQQAIESVSTLQEVAEIIVIDDASTDKTVEIIKILQATEPRLLFFQTGFSTPRGPSVARNIGLRASQSPFIAFLDADDYYLPTRFEHTPQLFDSNHTLDAVMEPVEIINTSGNSTSGSLAPQGHSSQALALDFLRNNNRAPHLNGLTLKKPISHTLSFDEQLIFAQDTLFFTQLLLSYQVTASDLHRPVAVYRIHGKNSIFQYEERKTIYPILAEKLLCEITPQQSYKIRWYVFKRSMIFSSAQRSKWRGLSYLYYMKYCLILFYRFPVLFPLTFFRAYLYHRGRP